METRKTNSYKVYKLECCKCVALENSLVLPVDAVTWQVSKAFLLKWQEILNMRVAEKQFSYVVPKEKNSNFAWIRLNPFRTNWLAIAPLSFIQTSMCLFNNPYNQSVYKINSLRYWHTCIHTVATLGIKYT